MNLSQHRHNPLQAVVILKVRRRRYLDPDKIIFRPDCIFCEKEGRKKVKVKGSWTTKGTVRFEYDGGMTLQRIAQENRDEHLLSRIRPVWL